MNLGFVMPFIHSDYLTDHCRSFVFDIPGYSPYHRLIYLLTAIRLTFWYGFALGLSIVV